MPERIISGPEVLKLLDAVSVTFNGKSYQLLNYNTCHTWVILPVGSPSAVGVFLEGSLDDVNWFDLDASTVTAAAGEMRHVTNKGVKYIRANLRTITYTGSPAANVTVLYTPTLG